MTILAVILVCYSYNINNNGLYMNVIKKTRLKKRIDRIRRREWTRSARYHINKYTKEIRQIQIRYDLEIKQTVKKEREEWGDRLERAQQEIARLQDEIKKSRKEYSEYFVLKAELELIKEQLLPAIITLKTDAIGIYQKFLRQFDAIEKVSYMHDRIDKTNFV